MDFFLQCRNHNYHSSSVLATNNKSRITFHGGEGEKKRNKRKNKMINTKVKLSTDPQSVAARERRHKISDKFKILRSLIPCNTRNMDTVSMLEEAIRYVKFLKSQIWLHQTMISFEDYDIANRNYPHRHHDHQSHQDLLPFYQPYGDHHHTSSLPQIEHEMLQQLGFPQGSCFKVQGVDTIESLSHDHHHVIYP